jgi:hypothetical protein
MKHYLAILLVLPLLMMPALASCSYSLASDGSELKAAIIDQLSNYYPNQAFINEATEILETHGFTVDVWSGEETTVSFYRELPQYGYKLILFRAHMGIAHLVGDSKSVSLEITSLFTGETYTTTKHVAGQLSGSIMEARMTEDHPTVFAVSPKFIADNMKGEFDDTAVLMMGCTSYYLDDMATAFVQKGASVYLGWSATVTLDYMDRAVINLIENLSSEQLSIEEATAQTMVEIGRDPYYGARLKYYPANSGHQTIATLIN